MKAQRRRLLREYLNVIIQSYGAWTYLILFAIIFCETGLVVTPFLPGDSLLFAAGAFAALGSLEVSWLLGLLVVAAIVGDTVNYWIGNSVGPRAFSGSVRFLKQDYLARTQLFYERHGGKAIVLARFIPIVCTFAPFVAGVGSMRYGRFILYNVAGGLVWVTLFTLGATFLATCRPCRQTLPSSFWPSLPSRCWSSLPGHAVVLNSASIYGNLANGPRQDIESSCVK